MTAGALRSMRVLATILILTGVWPCVALAQVYRLTELNTEQIRALDREKTVVLVPAGIMEQHGPYLPSFADGYFNERVAADLATAIARRPGWAAVIFPVIPLGASGANDIRGKLVFPGTYAIRPETLRAIFMDLATQFGAQGFRWVFLVHAHGAPAHNRALDHAGDYFRVTFGGRMIHLAGLDSGQDPAFDAVLTSAVTKEALAENGLDLHAGLIETSVMMALRPDLVATSVARAPSFGAGQHARRPLDAFSDLPPIAKYDGVAQPPPCTGPAHWARVKVPYLESLGPLIPTVSLAFVLGESGNRSA